MKSREDCYKLKEAIDNALTAPFRTQKEPGVYMPGTDKEDWSFGIFVQDDTRYECICSIRSKEEWNTLVELSHAIVSAEKEQDDNGDDMSHYDRVFLANA